MAALEDKLLVTAKQARIYIEMENHSVDTLFPKFFSTLDWCVP